MRQAEHPAGCEVCEVLLTDAISFGAYSIMLSRKKKRLKKITAACWHGQTKYAWRVIVSCTPCIGWIAWRVIRATS